MTEEVEKAEKGTPFGVYLVATLTLIIQILSILREVVVFMGGEGRFVGVSVVVSLIILYYLRRNEVKRAFSK